MQGTTIKTREGVKITFIIYLQFVIVVAVPFGKNPEEDKAYLSIRL
jgi:hypothetical protein